MRSTTQSIARYTPVRIRTDWVLLGRVTLGFICGAYLGAVHLWAFVF